MAPLDAFFVNICIASLRGTINCWPIKYFVSKTTRRRRQDRIVFARAFGAQKFDEFTIIYQRNLKGAVLRFALLG